MRMTLDVIADCLGAYGDLGEGAEGVVVKAVQTDSRILKSGEMFVCLPGENFDGHRFAGDAAKKGAVAILAQEPLPEITEVPVLLVRDTLQALGKLAAYWRAHTPSRVVAVTGSAGKTTVKEMIWTVLSAQFQTAKNYKNFNNQLGLPLTILGTSGEETAWVLELGISQPHDMDELGFIARPDLAVITNVGAAHLEGLGDISGVAMHKTSLLKHLQPGGRGIVNADYPELLEQARAITPMLTTFSTKDEHSDFFCTFRGLTQNGQGRFGYSFAGSKGEVELPYAGAHLAEDIAAVAATCISLGVKCSAVLEALSEPISVDQRFSCKEVENVLVIDDSYNANPISMQKAIEGAKELAGVRPLIFVLGDMKELGSAAVEEHEALGRILKDIGARYVFYTGDHARDVCRGMVSSCYDAVFREVTRPSEFAYFWAKLGLDDAVVLFKGSRSMKMEEYAKALRHQLRQKCGASCACQPQNNDGTGRIG